MDELIGILIALAFVASGFVYGYHCGLGKRK